MYLAHGEHLVNVTLMMMCELRTTKQLEKSECLSLHFPL